MTKLAALCVAVGVWIAAAGSAWGDSLSYGSFFAYARADDATGSEVSGYATTGSAGSATANDGDAFATTSWSLSSSSFTIGFDHGTTGSSPTNGYSYFQNHFSVDVDTTYSISGSYSFTELGSGGQASFDLILFDDSTGLMFHSQQYGSNRPGGTYYPGGTADTYSLTGSLAGTLLAGHTYSFYAESLVYHYEGVGAPLFGSGSVKLEIGSSVPEPATLALFGVGAAAMAWRRRRVRSLD